MDKVKYHFLKCEYCHRIDEIHRVIPNGSITGHRMAKHPDAKAKPNGEYHTWVTLYDEFDPKPVDNVYNGELEKDDLR